MFKRHLLSSAAYFAPRAEGSGADDIPDDERLPVDLSDDDETPHDPEDEPAGEDTGGGANDDEDAEDDDQHGTDDQDAVAPVDDQQPRTRGERQYAELRRQRREDAQRIAELTRQIDDIRRNPVQSQAPAETPAQRAERLALMSPEERAQEMVTSALAQHEQRTTQLTNQLLDQGDRTAFDAKASVNPIYKKLGPEIERRLAEMRTRGQNLPRNVIATYLIGERAEAQLLAGKKRPDAERRRQAQHTRPVNSGGDVQPDRRQRRGDGSVAAFERHHGDELI